MKKLASSMFFKFKGAFKTKFVQASLAVVPPVQMEFAQ